MKTIGAIDIGTNSIRLMVARVEAGHIVNVLASRKEVVRLGEGEFAHHRITQAAMDRGLLVLRNFAEMARHQGATDIVAVATAATREASNKTELVERARLEAGIHVEVISGLEEARLIYLGIVSGADIGDDTSLFIDIGGGTTEIVVGDKRDHAFLDSLKLGAIRLTDIFLSGTTNSVSNKQYAEMLDYVRNAATNAFRKIRDMHFDSAFGSSGTIVNLGEITARRLNSTAVTSQNYAMSFADLIETNALLRSLKLEERRAVPGINPERADIIIAGGAILEGVMGGVGARSITITDRALRDGLIVDHLFQEEHVRKEFLSASPRLRSVMSLCRACKFEEQHAQKVSDLACQAFGQLRDLGLHSYGTAEEELLRYAALTHDVGTFIALSDHHKHSYYLISNWGLLGFNAEEVQLIAATTLCHRKIAPKKAPGLSLSPESRRLLEVFASVIRIADALDRSQLGFVREVRLRWQKPTTKLVLEVYSPQDCPFEMWSLESKKTLFEQSFNAHLTTKLIVSLTNE